MSSQDFSFFFICNVSQHAWWIYDIEAAVREKASKSLSSDLSQSTLILFYIYLPPFFPYALSPKVWVFFSFQLSARPEFSFPHILSFFLLDTFSSSSYYLFNLTWSYRFFSPQPSPSSFLLFFLWTGSLPTLYYHTVSDSDSISTLLSTTASWKMLIPIKYHKNAFYLHYDHKLSAVSKN